MRFLQAHAAVTRRLEAELRDECDISLAEYETLLHLARAEEGRLRMSDLADPAPPEPQRRHAPRRPARGLRLTSSGGPARPTRAGRSHTSRPAGARACAPRRPCTCAASAEHFLDVIPEGEIGPLGRTLARLTVPDPAQDAVCAAAVDAGERAGVRRELRAVVPPGARPVQGRPPARDAARLTR